MSRTEISFAGLWNTTKPASVDAPTLQALLSTTYADLITLDQIALVADPFFADYAANHGGRAPFVDPAPLARWNYGRSLPAGRKDIALANKTVFMDWLANEVIKADEESCSDAIFLYPQSSGRTNYRNQYIRYARCRIFDRVIAKPYGAPASTLRFQAHHLCRLDSLLVASQCTGRYQIWLFPVRGYDLCT